MESRIVFAFGRFNPPTLGHELLINKIVSFAKKLHATPVVFLSRTSDKKKNPLPFPIKLKYAKKFFPDVIFVDDERVKNPLQAFSWIAENGFREVYFFAGSDRLENYKSIADHNKTRFDVVQAISAGSRDPDADDISGVSASKLRAFVKAGDYISFRRWLPSRATEKDAQELYKILQDILNEELDQLLRKYLGAMLNEAKYY